ncbi:hypothetical protein ACIBG7_15740 [Nonomuraea sp. NPDC050328]|uniref:hypothetical protein n=1 Tax=Nonomuraea sp. NPDC050328 TaxID=3364361 RepID=UPI0037B2C837
MNTYTEDQAVRRIEQLIRDTAATLTPRPRLELIASSVPPNLCLSDEDRVVLNRKYWLRDIPKSANMAISRQVRAFWEKSGYPITAVGGQDNPRVSGESKPDSFILALGWAEGDDLYLAATSPCVTPDAPTAPATPPATPAPPQR